MKREIRKAAVLGAGVMGATIAGHLANVGIPVLLLDIVPRELTPEEQAKGLTMENPQVRNRFAARGKELLLKSKPAPLFVPEVAQRIEIGNFEDDLPKIKDADWIIEVVVENLAIKQQLLARVAQYRKPGAIVSTNTSGISVNKMVEGLALEFRQHFLGTHFFNPPRYMKLLEIIPGTDTLPEIVEFLSWFGERRLGKGIVLCKDTPNFIANRIGVYGMVSTAQAMEELGLTPEEVDALTGPALGRPKSASFRTLDMVGLDTFLHVAANVRDNVTEQWEKEAFRIPEFLTKMVENKWLGDKTGQGFYQKVKTPEGKQVLTLDWQTLTYRPQQKVKLPQVEMAKQAPGGLAGQMKALVDGKDKYSQMAWLAVSRPLLYAARKAQEIADSILAIDKAMEWGFNWQMGPFATFDALGVEATVARMEAEGQEVPAWVKNMLAKGFKSFYKKEQGQLWQYDWNKEDYVLVEDKPGLIILKNRKEQPGAVIYRNSGASLVDLGDGVACLEFHSPNNAIGGDITDAIRVAVEEVEKNFVGLVVGNQGKNFCVGANLMWMLFESQAGDWDEIELMVRTFQNAVMSLKYCRRPVVAAPFGMTLGGGYEVCAHTHRIQAAAETYMGLVELGVGLIPAGGGCKELLLRMYEGIPAGTRTDLQPFVNKAFETIAMAKVSTSGPEAKTLGYLRASDGITFNSDYLIAEAREAVLAMDRTGFMPPEPKLIPVVGESGYATMALGAYSLKMGGYISEYDEHLAKKVAYVLSGGKVPAGTLVTEQYLLDLEREAFLSLAGEPKTQARMQHMLATGKPLRN